MTERKAVHITSDELQRRLNRIEKALVVIYRMIWPFLPRRIQGEAEISLVPIMREMQAEVERGG